MDLINEMMIQDAYKKGLDNASQLADKTNQLAYKKSIRVLQDSMTDSVINTGFWDATCNGKQDNPSATTDSGQTITEDGTGLIISGASSVNYWAGKGVGSNIRFNHKHDFRLSVDVYMDRNTTCSGAMALVEFFQDTSNVARVGLQGGFLYPNQEPGLYRSSWKDAIYDFNYNSYRGAVGNAAWATLTIEKRGSSVHVKMNGVLQCAFQWFLTDRFSIRLMGYARASGDTPIIKFRNLSVDEIYVNQINMIRSATPVIDLGLTGEFDDGKIKDIEVHKVGDTWHAWYTAYHTGYTTGKAHASSPNGPWVKDGQCSFSDSPSSPCAITTIHDGTMFHAFVQTSAGAGANIKHYTSTDGISWTLSDTALSCVTNTWMAGVYDPSICYSDGVYYLMYTATDNNTNAVGHMRTLGLATSTNLNGPWTNKGTVFVPNNNIHASNKGIEGGFIFRASGKFWCIYCGLDIGVSELLFLMVSDDGLSWKDVEDSPIICPYPMTFENAGTGHGCMAIDGETAYIFYQGRTVADFYRIGLVSAPWSEILERSMY